MAKETRWGLEVTPRDGAMRLPDAPGAWEWWYFDADFDNGYTMAGNFYHGSPLPPGNREVRFIEIALYDPAGNKRLVRKRYPKEQCTAAEDRCKVVIGPNIFERVDIPEGRLPKYHISFSENGQGCDLTYESRVESWMPKEPIAGHGPAPVNWLLGTCRAKISGTITWDDKTMEVKGEGYNEHVWCDEPVSQEGGMEYHHWGRLYIGDSTLNVLVGRNTRKAGHGSFGKIICYKKDKVVAVSYKGGTLSSDYTTEGAGFEYPKAVKMWWDDPGIVEGEIDFKFRELIECMDLHSRFKPFQRWYAETFKGRPAYFRSRFDYDADLTIAGEKVTGKGHTWLEHRKRV